jgi:hypothetical protein
MLLSFISISLASRPFKVKKRMTARCSIWHCFCVNVCQKRSAA